MAFHGILHGIPSPSFLNFFSTFHPGFFRLDLMTFQTTFRRYCGPYPWLFSSSTWTLLFTISGLGVIFPLFLYYSHTDKVVLGLKLLILIGLVSSICYQCIPSLPSSPPLPSWKVDSFPQSFKQRVRTFWSEVIPSCFNGTRKHPSVASGMGKQEVPFSTPLFHSPSMALPPFHMLPSFPLIHALLPVTLWLFLFSITKSFIQRNWLPPIDTTTLPAIDTFLVGKPAHLYFDSIESISLGKDLLAWFFYGIWHYVSAFVCFLGLTYWGWRTHQRQWRSFPGDDDPSTTWIEITSFHDPKHHHPTLVNHMELGLNPMEEEVPMTLRPLSATNLAHRSSRWFTQVWLQWKRMHPSVHHFNQSIYLAKAFLVLFGSVNLTGVMIQYVFPSAPPWYNVEYGTDLPPNPESFHGEPGGLIRIDQYFGFTFYTDLFGKNPLVFGAFPSLHSGFATCIALYLFDLFPWVALPWNPSRSWTRLVDSIRTQCGRGGRKASYEDRSQAVRSPGPETPLYLTTGVLALTYTLLVWWSTLYFTHHYLIDLLGGSLLTFCMYLPIRGKIHRMKALCTLLDALDTVPTTVSVEKSVVSLHPLDDAGELVTFSSQHRRQVSLESTSSGFHNV